MIQFLQTFFQSIAEFFSKIWSFLTGIFDELAQFFRMLKPAMQFVLSLLKSLPAVYWLFGVAMILVLIVYLILGRESGG